MINLYFFLVVIIAFAVGSYIGVQTSYKQGYEQGYRRGVLDRIAHEQVKRIS